MIILLRSYWRMRRMGGKRVRFAVGELEHRSTRFIGEL